MVVVAEDPDEEEVREIEEHTISSGLGGDMVCTSDGPKEHKLHESSGTLRSLHHKNILPESAVTTVIDTGPSNNEEALRSLAGAIAKVDDSVSMADGLLQVLPTVGGHGNPGHNQVILNTGSENQIVTIVPTSNAGEMSYVFIVEQSTAKEGSEKDDTVYDFTEVDEPAALSEEDEESQGNSQNAYAKINRVGAASHKRSQSTGSQAHMCNYCNYTSTKRYLLSRHMRSHSEERPHKCTVCDRGFKTISSLQNHLNTHTGVKPHRCKFCDTGIHYIR